MAKLTPKQELFIKEYLVDLNATQAAIRATYSPKTARQIATEMLSKPYIQDAIQAAMDNRSKKTEITADRVLKEIARLAFLDIREAFNENGQLLPITEMPENVARAIAGLEYESIGKGEESIGRTAKIRLIDKKGSLELLGKHLKLFTDKVEHTGKDGESLIPNDMDVARRVAYILTEQEEETCH